MKPSGTHHPHSCPFCSSGSLSVSWHAANGQVRYERVSVCAAFAGGEEECMARPEHGRWWRSADTAQARARLTAVPVTRLPVMSSCDPAPEAQGRRR